MPVPLQIRLPMRLAFGQAWGCALCVMIIGAVGFGAEVPGKQQGVDLARGQEFWAFQAVRNVALPAVKDAGWVRTPVDQFVLAKLEEKGLRPAPAATKLELIRRVCFDLTGLPPTPEEIG